MKHRTVTRLSRVRVRAAALLGALTLSLVASSASAQEQEREANTHFQRAVQLYAETDYRAALVEFKRAYEIAPHVTVLYNIGQAYYQLQNYAEALTTFERFLAEGGTTHRADVESAVAVLKTRVGRIDVTTAGPGWEITIDDEARGTSPLAKPIAVSLGRRRVTATKAGEAPQVRTVDVVAGDTVAVAFGAPPAKRAAEPAAPAKPEGGSSALLVVGWATTGALAASAVVTGILASSASSDLEAARGAFPADKADVDAKADKTTTLAIVTDVLAGSAIVLGGISLYFTLKPRSSAPAASASSLRAGVSGGRVVLGGSF